MIYFAKQWYSGNDRDTDPGEVLDPQPDMPKPQYRPGWTIAYKTVEGKKHIGKIRYTFRDGPGRLDFYRVVRTKNGAREITFACDVIERIQEETNA